MKLSINVESEFTLKSLSDLSKYKEIMDNLNMKINISEVARQLKKDRRTVKKYLDGFEPSVTRKRRSRVHDYYDVIKELLSDECRQKFYYKRILWQYLKDNEGLECADSTFRAYISSVPEFNDYFKYNRPIKSVSGTTRFETKYGKQAQFDWKENINFITSDGEQVKLNVAVFVLSRSRFKVMQVSLSKSQPILIDFLTRVFENLGGVPSEIVFDNMKTVMDISRTEGFSGEVNNKFQQFADDHNFKVKPCIAGQPRTKDKVETQMKLLDEIHAYQGKLKLEEVPQLISRINNRANSTVHNGTGRIPLLELEQEKKLLQPLPHEQIRASYKVKRTRLKVNKSNMINYKSNQYSVPAEYNNKFVEIQVYDNKIYVYYNIKLIATHQITTRKLNYRKQDYIETLRVSYGEMDDITSMATENLNIIGEMYNE